MTKLYEKNKLTFALIWIGAYVVLCSLADSLSDSIGITKIITLPVLLVMAGALCFWLNKEKLAEEFGLCSFKGDLKHYLYFLPLAVLITANLWNGVTCNLPLIDTVLYILCMMLVGLLEELIFRGLLFKAMLSGGFKSAFIVSSVTFGIGHIVNLLNGADFLPTLLQVCYAIAIGFLFTLIFYKGKSLWPCIITHGIFNSLSVFGVEQDNMGRILTAIILCVIPALYSLVIIKKEKSHEKSDL